MDSWMHVCMYAWMHGCMDAWITCEQSFRKSPSTKRGQNVQGFSWEPKKHKQRAGQTPVLVLYYYQHLCVLFWAYPLSESFIISLQRGHTSTTKAQTPLTAGYSLVNRHCGSNCPFWSSLPMNHSQFVPKLALTGCCSGGTHWHQCTRYQWHHCTQGQAVLSQSLLDK